MLVLKVDTENAAFEGENLEHEVVRILRSVADRIESGDDCSHFRTIFDINGNDVGRVKLTRDGGE